MNWLRTRLQAQENKIIAGFLGLTLIAAVAAGVMLSQGLGVDTRAASSTYGQAYTGENIPEPLGAVPTMFTPTAGQAALRVPMATDAPAATHNSAVRGQTLPAIANAATANANNSNPLNLPETPSEQDVSAPTDPVQLLPDQQHHPNPVLPEPTQPTPADPTVHLPVERPTDDTRLPLLPAPPTSNPHNPRPTGKPQPPSTHPGERPTEGKPPVGVPER